MPLLELSSRSRSSNRNKIRNNGNRHCRCAETESAALQQPQETAAAEEKLPKDHTSKCVLPAMNDGELQSSRASSSEDRTAEPERARRAAGSCRTSLFDTDDIFATVLKFVGPGHYVYAAGVSRTWRSKYAEVCCNSAASGREGKLFTSPSLAHLSLFQC
jgi:hypothetical protein